jgi:hypothetical protein
MAHTEDPGPTEWFAPRITLQDHGTLGWPLFGVRTFVWLTLDGRTRTLPLPRAKDWGLLSGPCTAPWIDNARIQTHWVSDVRAFHKLGLDCMGRISDNIDSITCSR